ncbi:zinc ABC transporter substrate-binding protein [Bacillus timonensis]|nr:zinc ABC transporter substrate-binding protein [Bacillus timonensis]
MKYSSRFILILLISMSIFTGCSKEDNTDKQQLDLIHVYTTIYPLEDFTKKIGGEYVDVKSVFPPGADAHSFEPTPKMMTKIAESDLFIYSGGGIEGFAHATVEALKNEQVKMIEASQGIQFLTHSDDHAHEHEDEHESEHEDEHTEEENLEDKDPHVWLDPIHSITLAENIKNALIEIKPSAKETFEANFLTLKNELETLDKEFSLVINAASKKEILVAHAAYGYWEERYGLEQIPVSGISPTDEPSQRELQALIDLAKEHNITYIIFEQNTSSKLSEIIQKQLGAKTLTLHNLEALTDEDIKNNEDYFSLMRKNIETIKTATQ